jgi:hypothetical protein
MIPPADSAVAAPLTTPSEVNDEMAEGSTPVTLRWAAPLTLASASLTSLTPVTPGTRASADASAGSSPLPLFVACT